MEQTLTTLNALDRYGRVKATRMLVAAAMILGCACGGGGDVLTPPPPPPPPPPSAPPTVSLSGTVIEERNGQAVSGATIAVAGVTATTGNAGQFTILGLSTGSVTLTVTAPSFDPLSKGISLAAGVNTVALTLMPVNTLYSSGAFDTYIPSEVSTVRGVFFVLFGGNLDSRPMIRRDFDYYRPPVPSEFAGVLPGYRNGLMAFARAQGFAVMGMTTPGGPDGLHAEIRQALGEVSTNSGHLELAHAPLLLQGHSRGGCMAYQVAGQDPERVIGVIPMAPQGVQPCLNGLVPASVPTYFILGELDIPSFNAAAINDFEQKRGSGAIWALAIERGIGHAWTTNHTLVFNWSAAVTARRLPQTIPPGSPVTLLQVSLASGWLGERVSGSVAGYPCFTGDQAKASWLPSEQTARDWQLVIGAAPPLTACAP